jgi:hypothetical protein
MWRSSLSAGVLLAGIAASGCTPVVSRYGPSYRYPLRAPAPLPLADTYSNPRGRWDQVMLLPAGSTIAVLTMDGVRAGKLSRADGYGVQVFVNGTEEEISRPDVMRVDLVDLPGSEAAAVAKRTVGGAALGVGAAALFGAVVGGSAWPPPGALLRAGAAAGGVIGAESELSGRQGRVIYIAEYQPTPARYGARTTGPIRPLSSIPAARWSEVMNLQPDAAVVVVTTSGIRHEGTLIGVDDGGIRLDLRGAELRVSRASVLRVDVLERPS